MTNATETAATTRHVAKARSEVGYCAKGSKARTEARRAYHKAARRAAKAEIEAALN